MASCGISATMGGDIFEWLRGNLGGKEFFLDKIGELRADMIEQLKAEIGKV